MEIFNFKSQRQRELESLLIEINDLSVMLDRHTCNSFWQKFLQENLDLGEEINRAIKRYNIPEHKMKRFGALIAQNKHYVPVQIDRKRGIFIKMDQLIDVKNELKDVLKKETETKIVKAKEEKNSSTQIL